MNDQSRQRRPSLLIPTIVAGLVAFGLVVAAGSYLRDPSPDWRKPVVVLGATAVFLVSWLVLLRTRRF